MTKSLAPSINPASGLLLLCLGVVWGGSFFFAKIALTEVPPLTVALHRVFWAVPVLLMVVIWKGIDIPVSMKVWLSYFVMGALNNAIPFSLIFWGQTHIDSGLASILNSTTAFFGVIVAGIFLVDERLTIRKITGALFGVSGVAAIMGIEALTNFNLGNLAQLAILGAALFYAFAGVWGKRFLSEYPPIMNAFGMLVASTALMFPVVVLTEGIPVLALSKSVWASLMAVAILSTAIAYLLYFKILSLAGSANLMLVTLLIPPIGVGLGVAFLDETMGASAGAGFGLIAIGLLITDGRIIDRFRQ
jgi:drug/metabolite transporter (DMT)-like permease